MTNTQTIPTFQTLCLGCKCCIEVTPEHSHAWLPSIDGGRICNAYVAICDVCEERARIVLRHGERMQWVVFSETIDEYDRQVENDEDGAPPGGVDPDQFFVTLYKTLLNAPPPAYRFGPEAEAVEQEGHPVGDLIRQARTRSS